MLVLHDGEWVPGWARDVRQEPDGRWRALVEYRVALFGYYQWRGQDDLRPRPCPEDGQ